MASARLDAKHFSSSQDITGAVPAAVPVLELRGRESDGDGWGTELELTGRHALQRHLSFLILLLEQVWHCLTDLPQSHCQKSKLLLVGLRKKRKGKEKKIIEYNSLRGKVCTFHGNC